MALADAARRPVSFSVCFLEGRIMLEHWAIMGLWDHILHFIVHTANGSY